MELQRVGQDLATEQQQRSVLPLPLSKGKMQLLNSHRQTRRQYEPLNPPTQKQLYKV